MICEKCNSDLGQAVISISGSIMGDEDSDAFFYCEKCGIYWISTCHDSFMGDETYSTRGPVSKEEGDKSVELIKKCKTPWDKKCRCPVHMEYFGGNLD